MQMYVDRRSSCAAESTASLVLPYCDGRCVVGFVRRTIEHRQQQFRMRIARFCRELNQLHRLALLLTPTERPPGGHHAGGAAMLIPRTMAPAATSPAPPPSSIAGSGEARRLKSG